MTWGKNDDGLHEHPKFRGLSLRAIGLWTVCRSYAAQNETDGYLAADIVREKVGRHSNGTRVALLTQELVDAGLWEVAIGGWMIHDYADWNITRTQKDAKRAAAAGRQRRHREAETRRTPDVPQTYSVPTADVLNLEVPAQRVVSRRDSRPIDVEGERSTQETSSLVPVSDVTLNAGHFMAAWIDYRGGVTPTPQVKGQVSRTLRQLCEAKIAPQAIYEGLITWQDSGYAPTSLQSFVDRALVRPAGIAMPPKLIGSRTNQMLVESDPVLEWAREADRRREQEELA